MIMSEHINELATALSLFQGEVMDASKDKKGYGYNYADLSNVLEIARPLMSKNGLSLAQFPTLVDGRVCVESVLMHKSGQFMSSRMDIPYTVSQKQSEAQAVGAVITYARRYSVGAILGITQTDTDACPKITQDFDKEENSYQKKAYNPKMLPPPSFQSSTKIIDCQVEELKRLIGGDLGVSKYIRQKYSIQHLEECNEAQYIAIKDELRIMKSKIEEPSLVEDSKFLNSKIA
jgi:hypothetical protein